jgi:hypothetical protein
VASLTGEHRAALREQCRRLLPDGSFEVSAWTWLAVSQV